MEKPTAESDPQMMERRLCVSNRLGLHARAAAKIAMLAHQYEADITMERGGVSVNAKSVLDILTMGCPCGSEIGLKASGPQAAEALAALEELFAQRFGES